VILKLAPAGLVFLLFKGGLPVKEGIPNKGQQERGVGPRSVEVRRKLRATNTARALLYRLPPKGKVLEASPLVLHQQPQTEACSRWPAKRALSDAGWLQSPDPEESATCASSTFGPKPST